MSPSRTHFIFKPRCEHIDLTMSESTQSNNSAMCSDKTVLRKNRQKRLALQARLKYREQSIKSFQRHLKQGTFPKRMKSIKPFPKMNTREGQTIVNEACEQVQKVILDQMLVEEQQKLTQEQALMETLKEEQLQEQPSRKKSESRQPRKPAKKSSVVQLQEELTLLQTSVAQLCSLLDTSKTPRGSSCQLI